MALVPLTLISEQESINMTMKYGKVFNKFGLMTIAMAFAGMVYAGSEPAPPNQPFRLSQPSIKGSLVFLPAASCGGESSGCTSADLIFAGSCQKESVQVVFPEFPLGDFLNTGEDITSITAAGLDGRYLDLFYATVIAGQNPLLAGSCSTDPSMAITSVNDFVNRTSTIGFVSADVTLKFAPPK